MTDPIEYLLNLPRFDQQGGLALKPGLERIRLMLEMLGSPHTSYRSVHVAGTNGKGSTASLIAAVGTSCGLRVGLHTSPHLWHIGELMRVNGQPADERWIADKVDSCREIIEHVAPSFFEVTVALSLTYFAEERVDLAVVEVGLGGRLDATNIIMPEAAVITNIGLEHQQFLGTTIEAIAAEKAGIIKKGIPIVTSAHQEAAAVIRSIAAEKAAPLHHVGEGVNISDQDLNVRGCTFTASTPLRVYENLFVGLPGKHQIANAATALRTCEIVYDRVQSDARPVFEGMRHVRKLSGLRGRLEVLRDEPLIIADVAHNAEGLAAAIDHIETMRLAEGRLFILLGVMRDKDIQSVARRLADARARVRPVEIASERALPAAELAAQLRGWGIETDRLSSVDEGIRDFLAAAKHNDALLISGSHLVVSQLENLSM